MKRLRIFTICALLAFAGDALADDGLRIADFSIVQGETKTISVELDNANESYIMLDFLLRLPDGVAIDKDDEGELLVVQNDERFTRSHIMEFSEKGSNIYHVLIYSSRNASIKGSSGELFSMTITADADAPRGDFQGRFYEQVFSNPEEQEYDPADSYFNVTITKNVELGDVNDDGIVSISDAVVVVNYILTNGNPTGNFVFAAADTNNDGSITITDAVGIVNIILNQ